MALVEVTLPKWGLTMEEGTLVEWMVKQGDQVKTGQVIAAVETDKVSNELESPVDGTVAEICFESGTESIKVGETLCTIQEG